jgi:glycosyltransferase involved in cell wall biosynthesis
VPVPAERAPSRGGPAFCTVIAKNYLAHARALARSLRRHHPTAPLYVLLVDEVEGRFDPAAEEFTPVPLSAIDLPDQREMCFRYELLELCTAVKPWLLRWAFARGHSRLVFLDPDVWVYRPLDELLASLDEWDVVLTPHLTRRVDDGRYPDEHLILLVGTYNLGFLALARSAGVDRLLEWWAARCRWECTLERQRGLFLDQKWMNLVPGFLERVLVLRHPGYNLAHWNLEHRTLSGPPEAPLVNGRPLYFLHASSVDPLDPARLLCPQTRYERLEGEPLTAMLRGYSAELLAAGYQACRTWPYTFAHFDDGHPIHPEMRQVFRGLPAGRFPDPFHTRGKDTFRQWALQPRAAPVPAVERTAGDTSDGNGDGVTVAGYLRAESGMGELARSTVRALRRLSYPFDTLELHDGAHRQGDLSAEATPTGGRRPVTLAVLTAPDALRHRPALALSGRGRYAIGYWPWELEAFPDDLGDVFAGFDEVWALSRFSAAAIAAASSVPVHTVWPALPDVAIPAAGPPPLDPAEYHFLFVYDVLSETARKNPDGLLGAFRRAFHPSDPVRLTVKAINGKACPDDMRRVVDAAEGLRVTVRDDYLSRGDLLRLMGSCDCYVSLHRSEGFGFTLVEAMALGRPVIATYYSGNTEYMTPWSCFPVPYRMTEVGARRGAYRPGDVWAEPDLEAAAEMMRRAWQEPDLARAVGDRGRREVERLLSLEAVGARMAVRLRAAEKDRG